MARRRPGTSRCPGAGAGDRRAAGRPDDHPSARPSARPVGRSDDRSAGGGGRRSGGRAGRPAGDDRGLPGGGGAGPRRCRGNARARPPGAAAGFAGLAAWAAGDLGTAVDTFSEAVTSLHAAGMVADELGATVVLATMWLARGRPLQARRLYEDALAAAERQPGRSFPVAGDLHVGLAEILVEQGDLDGAVEQLEIAGELGDGASLLEARYRRFTATAGLLVARGELARAADMLDRAEQLYLPGFNPDVRPIPAARTRIRIAQGRLDDAVAWARHQRITVADPVVYLSEYNQLTLARLLLAQHRAGRSNVVEDALGLLDRVIAAAESAGRDGSVIEARWLRALAHHARGDLPRALDDLGRAVAEAVPAGFRRLFLDEGTPAEDLLRAAAGRPDRPGADQANILLDALDRTSSSATVGPAVGPEALSEREVEVLRLLASDLTGPAIASRLFVSINTFRTHTRHIFAKLDVTTRRAAVTRARELGLM